MKTLTITMLVTLLAGCSSLPYVTRNDVSFGPFESRTHKNIKLKDLDVTMADGTKVKVAEYTATADPNAATVALEEARLRTALVESQQAALIQLVKDLAAEKTSTK